MCNKEKLERATTFKKGDKIWHTYYGNLIVLGDSNNSSIETRKIDKEQIITFTNFVNLYKGHYEEGSIEIYGTPVFENPFKQGDIVWVRDANNSEWAVRYYSHYDEKYKMHCCYIDQKKLSAHTIYWKQILPFSQNPLI